MALDIESATVEDGRAGASVVNSRIGSRGDVDTGRVDKKRLYNNLKIVIVKIKIVKNICEEVKRNHNNRKKPSRLYFDDKAEISKMEIIFHQCRV